MYIYIHVYVIENLVLFSSAQSYISQSIADSNGIVYIYIYIYLFTDTYIYLYIYIYICIYTYMYMLSRILFFFLLHNRIFLRVSLILMVLCTYIYIFICIYYICIYYICIYIYIYIIYIYNIYIYTYVYIKKSLHIQISIKLCRL
jgi:hypothetical protein